MTECDIDYAAGAGFGAWLGYWLAGGGLADAILCGVAVFGGSLLASALGARRLGAASYRKIRQLFQRRAGR